MIPKIGTVSLASRALLAPMAGLTDRAYRELCMSKGAAYCVSEMVSSKALSFNSKKSEEPAPSGYTGFVKNEYVPPAKDFEMLDDDDAQLPF